MCRVPNVLRDDGSPGYLWKGGRPSSLTWEDFAWVRERWDGPLVAKGVLTAEDAIRAVDCGVDAVIVSNHGGRQLDGTDTTLHALPDVVAAADGRCTVLMDGGIRRGNDVIKAISLGADRGHDRSALAKLRKLGAAGQSGIEQLLEKFRADLVRDIFNSWVTRV